MTQPIVEMGVNPIIIWIFGGNIEDICWRQWFTQGAGGFAIALGRLSSNDDAGLIIIIVFLCYDSFYDGIKGRCLNWRESE